MKVSKPLPQSDLETVTNEHYKEIPKERNVFTEERHQMIDELRLTLQYNSGISRKAEATDYQIGNKIANAVAKFYDGKITKVSRSLSKNSSETNTNEHDKKISKKGTYFQKKCRKLLIIWH